jgi:mRNA-capping enzyme
VKINCRGHGETPSREHVDLFLNVVETFVRQKPTELIGVHCTHGFNRTGFLICSYLVEKLDMSVDTAVAFFADARPPGIYKQDYINELFRLYGDPLEPVPVAPALPQWETTNLIENTNEDEDDVGADGASGTAADESAATGSGTGSQDKSSGSRTHPKKRNRPNNDEVRVNVKFADPNLEGVDVCIDTEEISRVRSETQAACGWNGAGFPGAQPISMDQQNIRHLVEKRYQVSWKADGTR